LKLEGSKQRKRLQRLNMPRLVTSGFSYLIIEY